jgi:hypothetical protein
MSSVTFLVSAVLTVCVLHAFDQNGVSASIDKLNFDAQAKADVSKPVKAGVELNKPLEVQISAPSANVYGAKKNDHLLPTSQNSTKNIALKDSKAI